MLYLQPFFINIIASFSFINIFANCQSKETINVKLNFKRDFYEKKIDAVNDLPDDRYWSGKRSNLKGNR